MQRYQDDCSAATDGSVVVMFGMERIRLMLLFNAFVFGEHTYYTNCM